MKTTHILCLSLALALSITSCKKNEPQPATADTTAQAPSTTPPAVVDDFQKFKADAETRIKAIEDSIDAYDARIAGPKQTAAMKKEQMAIKARLSQMRAELATPPKDEAAGSWKRVGDAFNKSFDTIGHRVNHLFTGK